MGDLAELQKRQAEAAQIAARMAQEQDPDRILALAAEVQKRAAEIEKMGRAFEAGLAPAAASGGSIEVALTRDQKERVTQQTGVGVERVTLHDARGRVWARDFALGKVHPREVEKEAAKEAARLRLIAQTRQQVEAIAAQLEALNVPELDAVVADLRRDPTLGRG